MKNHFLIIIFLFPLFAFAQKKEIIRVTNADEFVKAIGSNRTIILSADTFRLRNIAQLKNFPLDTEGFPDYRINDHVSYSAGWGVAILDVTNLTIVGDSIASTHSLLSTSDEGDQILTFSNCNGISIRYIDAVHILPTVGGCTGGVLFFNACKNVWLSNSTLSGCGSCGILCDNDTNFFCTKCLIHECSSCLMELKGNQHLLFEDCVFTKIKALGCLIELADCNDLHFVRCDFNHNEADETDDYYKGRVSVFNFYEDKKGKDILLQDCIFSDNKLDKMTNRDDLLVRNNVKYINNNNLK